MGRSSFPMTMFMLLLILAVMLRFDVPFAGSEPMTWIVDDDGPADFNTIQEAINAASSGDTIFVRNGTYYENLLVNKTVSLIGEDWDMTVIDGNWSGNTVTINASYVALSGFTIRKGTYGVHISGSGDFYCDVSKNRIVGNSRGIRIYTDNNTILENTITANEFGLGLDGGDRNIIAFNNITANIVTGITLVDSRSNTFVYNNISDMER